jgi:hypothetical protein
MYATIPPETFVNDLTSAYASLQAIKEQQSDDPERPSSLPVESVQMVPHVFQVRGFLYDQHHVSVLMDVLANGNSLDAIIVWRCGAHALLIDGHHRLAAYKRHELKAKELVQVPVTWLEAPLDKAIEEAATDNVKTRLQMTPEQRGELAWRWTVWGRWSKQDTASRAGVSTSLVAKMRKLKKEVGDGLDPDWTWKQAQHATKGMGIAYDEDEIEAMVEHKVTTLANRMAKEFSTKLAHEPDIAARVLDRYFGRKSREVLRLWAEEQGFTMSGDVDEDAEF